LINFSLAGNPASNQLDHPDSQLDHLNYLERNIALHQLSRKAFLSGEKYLSLDLEQPACLKIHGSVNFKARENL